jgi:hypothetical protein
MRFWVAMGLLLVGCNGPTSVLVRIGGAADGPLDVTVSDPRGPIGHATLASPSLPGSVILRGLPDINQRIQVDLASGALGTSGSVTTMPHAQVTLDLTLGSELSDGGSDGGVDLSGTDGGVVGPMDSKCSIANLAFCDGFESATIDAHWTDNRNQGAVSTAIDTTRFYRGKSSLKLHHDAMAANDIAEVGLGETQTFPSQDYWIRAFVYIPSPGPGEEEALLYNRQTAGSYDNLELAVDQNGYLVTFNNTGGQSTIHSTSVSMPLDRWVCLEQEVIARALGGTHVYLDGTEVTGLAGTQSLIDVPALSSVQFTLIAYKPSKAIPARDIWYDEVAVDPNRIGCDN